MAAGSAAPAPAPPCFGGGRRTARRRPAARPCLRWVAFYASCFEPVLIDKAQKREPAAPSMAPYSDCDTTLKTLTDQLCMSPCLLSERFSAADVQ